MKISEIISDNCDLLANVAESEEKQKPCEDEYIKVPKKALKYRTAGMVAYNVEWLKSHFDLERTVICGEQELCEDTISRQAVLSKIKEVCFSEEWEQFRVDNGSNGQRDFLINYIEQLSSVSSSEKPNKSGQWIERVERDDWDDYEEVRYECDQCHVGSEIVSNYCPACGAKMSEGSEKE